MSSLTNGKLNNYLSDIDQQAEDMFIRLVKEMPQKQGIGILRSALVISFIIYQKIKQINRFGL